MKRNYRRTDETTIVDPAYIGKAPKIEIAGISYKLPPDRISIRRTMNETCNRLQFFPDNPDRKYTPGEIMTMKELDSRARAYFNRCRIVPSAIYEKVFRPK